MTIPLRPKKRGGKMTVQRAVEWIAFTARRDAALIWALELEEDQYLKLGRWFAENRLLNPPRRLPEKIITQKCKCGCGQTFTTTYKTRKPKYINDTHRQRAYRARKQKS